jgi:hypothetical protein
VVLTLVPDPSDDPPAPNGDGVVLEDGSIVLRVVSSECKLVGAVTHSIRCDVAFASSSKLIPLDDLPSEFNVSSLDRRIVLLRVTAGLIRVFTTHEMVEAATIKTRRTASVLLGDGTWLAAAILAPIGRYSAVRWDGGLAMLT